MSLKDFIRPAAVLVICFLTAGFGGNSLSGKIREGNKLLKDGKAGEAITAYNDAQLEDPTRPEIHFNMGNAFYRQNKFPEALEAYQKAMENGDASLEAKAYYNTGNALFKQGMLREALEAYKQALDRDPEDTDTKYNLEFTEHMIKEMLSKAQETMQQAQEDREQKEQQEAQAQGAQSAGQKESQDEEEGEQAQGAQAQAAQEAGEDKKEEDSGQAQKKEEEGQGGENEEEGEQAAGVKKSEEAGREGEQKEGEPKDPGDLTEEEAERYLSVFEKSQDQSLVSPQQRGKPRKEYVEKDW